MDKATGSRIGPTMHIVGEVVCDGSVQVAGSCRGSLVCDGLRIESGGQVVGSVRAGEIDCAGHLEGEIVSAALTLRQGGQQVGRVATNRLRLEPGAEIDFAQPGSAPLPRPLPPARQVLPTLVAEFDRSRLRTAFAEGTRPCCSDIPGSARGEVFRLLVDLLLRDKPLLKLTGTAGCGKTELARRLLRTPPDGREVVAVSGRPGSVAELVADISRALAVTPAGESALGPRLTVLRDALAARRVAGVKVVLLLDAAEELYPATLEGLVRQLTAAIAPVEEGLQFLLLGRPEMEDKMVATTLEYFEDETNCQLRLDPLSLKDTADYLRLALRHAAGKEQATAVASLFPYETIKAIHRSSEGNLAATNRVAAEALGRALAAGANEVAVHYVEAAPPPAAELSRRLFLRNS